MSYVRAGLSGTFKGLIAGGLCFLAVPALAPVGFAYAGMRGLIEASRNIAAEHNTGGSPPQSQSSMTDEQKQQIEMENEKAWRSVRPCPIVGARNDSNRSGGSQVATA